MRDRNLLFFEENLDAHLCARQQQISSVVDGSPKDQFLVSSEQELTDYVVARFSVEPLALREEERTMNQHEAQVDVSRDQTRYFSSGRSGPSYIPGTRVVENRLSSADWRAELVWLPLRPGG